ncbi:MAG: dTDP-glucose 4,6-dehydratase [Chloroflexi bacterium]|nr:dTDP-glucose 4,6-dehydratase [Chloroflexota bacterium]
MRILVCGGAGFIGSSFVRHILDHSADEVVVFDKLTYAGNLDNLSAFAESPRYRFIRGDIADVEAVRVAMQGIDAVVNFAAESHVDRSILNPGSFITTDVYGAYVLLEAARSMSVTRFLQVSTDEVYGEVIGESSHEGSPLRPRSPYSASKAGGEHLVQAYHVTYGIPTLVTRGSNTFGPHQYPEKLIPVVITEALDDRPVPIYGDGLQIRDWLFVDDHCSGVDAVLRRGTPGETYNIGGGNLHTNLELVERILDLLGKSRALIQHVPDRPGHDRGYSIDSAKLLRLGWTRDRAFDEALETTVKWYVDNEDWWRRVKATQDYQTYFERNYSDRESLTVSR